MTDYSHCYHVLFNAITDALAALEQTDYGQAAQILMQAQQRTEELYLDEEA